MNNQTDKKKTVKLTITGREGFEVTIPKGVKSEDVVNFCADIIYGIGVHDMQNEIKEKIDQVIKIKDSE